MKIVVAVDTFKGSLSSLEAGSAISEGIHRVMDAFFPILRTVTTLDDAMCPETARKNMVAAVEQVFRLIKTLGLN